MDIRLRPKQKAFIYHYLTDARFNATEAARKAGYSLASANSMGQENLAKPAIKAQIEAELSRLKLTEEEILEGLGRIAKSGKQESNQVRAYEILSRIKGMMKDSAVTQFAVFERFEKEVDGVTRRVAAQGVEVKEDKKIL